MTEKVRRLFQQDERVVAALTYGSFALSQGDRFSDIEFYLFSADNHLTTWRRRHLHPLAPFPLRAAVLQL